MTRAPVAVRFEARTSNALWQEALYLDLLVQAVLTHMLEDEDYFFFALSPDGRATAFRSEVGQDVLFYVRANLPRLQASAATEAQYDLACLSFARNPRPPGPLLHWVCLDNGVSGFEHGPV